MKIAIEVITYHKSCPYPSFSALTEMMREMIGGTQQKRWYATQRVSNFQKACPVFHSRNQSLQFN